MKTTTIVISVLLLIPSVSSAALTQPQAESLIGVVQSSPGTPASAFTELITAFSNITVAQANSLIVVVQSAVTAPASAFIDLLLSFTVDQPILGAVQPPTPTPAPTPAPVDNQPPAPLPVVQLHPMNPTLDWISIDHGNLHVTANIPLDISKTILPDGVTLGDTEFNDRPALVNRNGKTVREGHGYGVALKGLPAEFTSIEITLVTPDGGTVTAPVIVRY